MNGVQVTLVVLLILAVLIALAVFIIRINNIKIKKGKYIKSTKDVNRQNIIKTLNESSVIDNFGSKFYNQTELELLFRKSKNPWNLAPATYNAIRYGGGAVCMIAGAICYFAAGWYALIIGAIIAFLFIFVPASKYKEDAKAREHQWNQLYQFMWVIKHNASFYDPKKVFNETHIYIEKHAPQLTELIEGFKDFADHWNNVNMDEYLTENYGCFEIPNELYNIMLTSQQTGEFPEKELNNLRNIILGKMDFAIKEVLAMTATQATIRSTPFLLITMAIIVIFPTMMSVLSSFS